jgi:hypothetical protein
MKVAKVKLVAPMQKIATSPRAIDADDALPAHSYLISESVVLEASADQGWREFCMTLQSPALLLGDVVIPDSE